MHPFEVYESNSGGLFLIVYNELMEPIYFHGDYEFCPGQLLGDISELRSDNIDPSVDWDGNEIEDLPAFMAFVRNHPKDYDIIANRYAIYPEFMGLAGKREFQIDE